MKTKIFLFFGITFLLLSCSESKKEDKTYFEQYAESLITQYPNYESNDIAKSAIKDSIKNHAESFIGKNPKDLEGIEFSFSDFREGKEGKCAIFTAYTHCDIEAPKNSDRERIISTAHIAIFGKVSDDIATILDSQKRYSISGRLHAWDGDNKISVLQSIAPNDLDFGIYILDDMQVKEIQQ